MFVKYSMSRSDLINASIASGMTGNRSRIIRLPSRSRRLRRNSQVPRFLTKRSKRNLKRAMVTFGEKKYFISQNVILQGDVATIGSLSDVPQASTDTSRNGDQITVRSIELDWIWSAADSFNIVRTIVFQWFPSGTPTASDLLILSVSLPYISPYNHDQRFKYKILMDVMNSVSTTSGQYAIVKRKYILGGFKRKIQYDAGGTNGTNKIYILTVSDSGVVINPTVNYIAKLNFSDN